MNEFIMALSAQTRPFSPFMKLKNVRFRLRSILMTLFAFILGVLPLWFASGAGAVARRVLGTAVVSGMLAATLLGVFFIPSLFVTVERIASRRRSSKVGRLANGK